MAHIGTLNEKPLHASLKEWYARPGDQFEAKVDRFVIDIVRGDQLLEVQTANFSSIKRKINKLTGSHRLRLIYPVAQEKWIIKRSNNNGKEGSRRKSPRKGRIEDVFRELVNIPTILISSNFSLEVLLIKEEEVRRHDKKRAWRRKGWTTEERRLVEVVGQKLFKNLSDWRALLPEALDENFTTADLVKTLSITRDLAQKMAYCLRHAGVIDMVGKQGRAYLYRMNNV